MAVDEKGTVRNVDRRIGAERYVEEGVCCGCGVRTRRLDGIRRFVHESMIKDETCALCGVRKKTPHGKD